MKKYLDPKADLAFKEIFGELEELLDNPRPARRWRPWRRQP